VLLGVLIFQFLERVPDRQAVELVKYHLGWELALNLKLSDQWFHPTMLIYFRPKETTFSPEKVPVTSSAEGAVEVKRVNGINRRAHAASVGSSLFMPDYGLDRNVTFSLQDNQKLTTS
jgi:hypothetical protein